MRGWCPHEVGVRTANRWLEYWKPTAALHRSAGSSGGLPFKGLQYRAPFLLSVWEPQRSSSSVKTEKRVRGVKTLPVLQSPSEKEEKNHVWLDRLVLHQEEKKGEVFMLN